MSNEPYHHFGTRRHPDDYRKEEIQKLKRAIQATENRLVLSMPDVGLSNLIRFLVSRPDWGERKPIFAYLDCNALEDCLNRELLFTEIARQFYEQDIGDRLDEEAEGYERLYRLLHEVGGDRLSDPPLVIVVNKTDRMLMGADKAFNRKLKVLADINTRVCYILAGGLCAANTVDRMEPLFAGRRLRVGRFNERDFATAITEEGQRLSRKFNPTEHKQLAYLTGGHAGLLRAISSAVDDLKLDLSEPEEIQIEILITREDVQSRCNRIWNVLDPVQQATLYAIAREQPDLADEDVLVWLKKFDLIEELEGEYRLFSPIFQRFVATQEAQIRPITPEKPPEPARPEASLEPIRIDKPTTIFRNEQEIIIAGKVFKGNQEVHISPLELRLIACLKRERKIYTRDEIDAYVYYEDYEKGGVSSVSQIDNLVRQVRKRLGDSRYIKNHHGQGYEFVGEEDEANED